MKIDPKVLRPVTEQDLIDEGFEPHIAAVRAEHLAEKRVKRIEMIENTIRSGMLKQLTAAMQSLSNPNQSQSKTAH